MGHKICPYCGAALDAGEKCDCRDEAVSSESAALQEKEDTGTGQDREHNRLKEA